MSVPPLAPATPKMFLFQVIPCGACPPKIKGFENLSVSPPPLN